MNQTIKETGPENQLSGKDRRREPRFDTSQPVTLTVMGPRTNAVMDACVLNISDRGVRLRVPTLIPAGAVIKATASGVRMLGEVLRCVETNGAYHVGVQLFHSLSATADLNRLNRWLLQESDVPAQNPSQAQENTSLPLAVEHVHSA